MKFTKRTFLLFFVLLAGVLLSAFFFLENGQSNVSINVQRLEQAIPNGQNMMNLIGRQLNFGPRHIGSSGHEEIKQFLSQELRENSDTFVDQQWNHTSESGKTYELHNLIARFKPEKNKRILLGTHYDTQRFAHNDSSTKEVPVPGANDGGSGTAVLLELAKVLKNTEDLPADVGIDIVLFDGEEDEGVPGGDYSNWQPLGSTYFVNNLTQIYPERRPDQVIVLDMICDKKLKLAKEHSSLRYARSETERYWQIGEQLAPGAFIENQDEPPHIIDDQTPFGEAGIPSFLVIDFTYPPFHTAEDTLDKCSPESLTAVARTTLGYVYTFK